MYQRCYNLNLPQLYTFHFFHIFHVHHFPPSIIYKSPRAPCFGAIPSAFKVLEERFEIQIHLLLTPPGDGSVWRFPEMAIRYIGMSKVMGVPPVIIHLYHL